MNKHCIERKEPLNNFKHYLKIMRITLFFLFFCILFSSADNSFSQEFSFNLESASIREICKQIEKESDFIFVFSDNCEKLIDKKINIESHSKNVTDILDAVLSNTGLTYKILDNQIVVFESKKKIPINEIEENSFKNNNIQQEKKQITGTVLDEEGLSVIGANIVEVGTTNGTVTDVNGNFSLNVSDDASIHISYIGYLNQTLSTIGKINFKIILVEDSKTLDEIVVVGYGQQSRITLTGSISAIKQEDLETISAPTLGEGILGKAAGISMTQSSGTPGESDPSMYIRGIGTFNATEPLFIIDGVPNDKRAFMQLNPASIKDVSILKDASATAVYGVKGANGVIIVTTRRGKVGKISVDAQLSYGIQVPRKLLEFADSYQYSLAYNQMLTSDGKTSGFISDEHIEHYRLNDEPLLFPNKNWVNEVINNTAPQSRANLNISGGTENIQYFSSISYLTQDGLLTQYGPAMADFGYNRINLQTNIDIDITSSTRLLFTGSSRIGSRIEPLPVNTVTMSTLWGRLYSIPPMTSYGVYDGKFVNPDMRYLPEPIAFIEESFPQYLYRGDFRTEEENRFDFNFDFIQKFSAISPSLDGLNFRAKIGYRSGFDKNKVQQGDLTSLYTAIYNKDAINPNPNVDDNAVVFKKTGENGTKSWRSWYVPNRYMYFETGFDYEKTLGKHYISGLVLYNQNKDYFPPGDWAYSYIPTGNVGLVGRINYNYNQQYMVEVNLGYNGSENFARKKRFGLFPSLSAGWVVSEEKFMQDIEFIDQMKLRFSYGVVGSDQAGGSSRFTYIGTGYNRDIAKYYGYNFGDDIPEFRLGVRESSVGNSNVTWETAKKQNYGLDLQLFNNQINFSFDYFYEYRNDILMSPKSTPGFVGFTMPVLNIGEVKNQGFDIVAGWNGKINDFKYTLDGNFTFSKNKILFMDEIPPVEPYQTTTGHPLNTYYGYIWEGFYTQEEVETIDLERESEIDPKDRTYAIPTGAFVRPGDMKYADLNNDGVIDQIDTKVIGYPRDPQILAGLNGSFSWKNFDLSLGLQGVSRVSRQLGNSQPFGSNNRNSLWLPFYESSWTPERAEAGTVEWPRISVDNKSYNTQTSTFWIRDASYLRLKRAELGYTVKSIPIISQLRIYISGTNLITWQKKEFRWTDPELQSQTYPLVKLYSVGLNVTF